ncbi:helix-turn-helix domain-containing protein [Streptomyces sp. NPDC091268]|uniref:helix-turn-helix domain-containing protein n=1 Tax=Streptomyces sp. NPDC091268 TaxID=3365979 RepID=UPI00380D2A06
MEAPPPTPSTPPPHPPPTTPTATPLAAPPTAPVPLAALLADRELGLRHLAGPAEADVHGVHASEMADPSPYLLGGELLLTAGAELGAARADPDAYVRGLLAAGAAALGFGVAPVHEEVPAALAAACARRGLPLLEVPPRTPFTAVARGVWRLMAEARTRELRRVTEAQQSLAAAAARADPVAAVLSRLAAALDGYVALFPAGPAAGPGSAGTGAAAVRALPAAGRVPPDAVAAALAALPDRLGPPPGGAATATDSAAGWHLAAYALGDGPALGVARPERAPGDHAVTAIAAVLLTLLTAHRPAGDEAAALTRLLLDGDPAQALAPGPWYAVHARGAGDPGALAAALRTVLLDPRGDGVRLLADREPGPQPGWRLGVSAPAAPSGLRGAAAQARRALQRAEAARTPLARHSPGGVGALLDPAEARAHAEALLAPLSRAQRETLRGWLAHHGGWDRAAAALGVHRNTVRQRVARCAVLLGADLDDPDTRMELWFALRALDSADNSPVT